MHSNFTKSNVIILCGGQGKRLGNITKKIPKPLIKLGRLSIIEHKLNYYKKQGLKEKMITLRRDGVNKILHGLTTAEEILAITSED